MSELAGRTYLGLDLGGTFLKAARVDSREGIADRLRQPVSKGSAEALFAQLEAAVRSLAGPDDPASVIRGVGVGLPGIVDRVTSRLKASPNVPVLDGFRVGEDLARRVGVPCFAENDANAAALADAYRGAGRGVENLLLVTLGTGIGGGVILGGRIFSGHSGFAGEIGHIQAEPDGVPCGCGSRGCLETVAGAAGWIGRAEAARAARATSLRGRELSPAVIVEAASGGDAVAIEVVEGTARALGVGIAAALNLLNLERVVIAGGVSAAGPLLLDRIVEQTRLRLFPQVFADCSFRLAELGPDAGVLGAACVAMQAAGDLER